MGATSVRVTFDLIPDDGSKPTVGDACAFADHLRAAGLDLATPLEPLTAGHYEPDIPHGVMIDLPCAPPLGPPVVIPAVAALGYADAVLEVLTSDGDIRGLLASDVGEKLDELLRTLASWRGPARVTRSSETA